ncbi:MAG TPA: hypothetical protein VFZ44_08265 [Pyrinomonadaceae bacterium]
MQIGKFLTAAGCPSRIARRMALGSLAVFLFAGAACPSTVKVPGSADQDQAPAVKIGYATYTASPKPEAGDFKYATQSGDVDVPLSDGGKNYMITADATNPKGGVKELKLEVGQGVVTNQTVTHSQAVGSGGTALPSLGILGTDTRGGIGPQPILLGAGRDPAYFAKATATNFNGQATSIQVFFKLQATPPVIQEFSVWPNDSHPDLGYINAGDPATLKWRVACGANVMGCSVVIRGVDGEPDYRNPVLFLDRVGLIGDFVVRPAQKSKYTLTATNTGRGNLETSKTIQVSIFNPLPPSNLRTFCFKMNCNSTVNPCFTTCIVANDESQAKQWAESWYGGCTATAISPQDFENGCRR